MSTTLQKKHRDLAKMVVTIIVVFIVAMIAVLTLGGCSAAEAKPDPKASKAASPTQKAVEQNPNIHAFGDTVTYDDGLSLSVSLPSVYTPTETSSGVEPGKTVIAFEYVVTNNTDKPFDPSIVLPQVSSGGVEAHAVFDIDGQMGFPPMTAVLPGQTIKWTGAWSVADIENVTMEVSMSFVHDNQIFTNVK